MTLAYDECLKKGKIKPFSRGRSLAAKELKTAASDLDRAEKTYKDCDYKWATIQIYFSMFHSARALLYSKNLREHSHYCLIEAIQTLFVFTKILPGHLLEGLRQAKNLREEADYYNRWSKVGCENLLQTAREFLEKAKAIIEEQG
ncbi:MAG: hypothetical protein A2170_15705 [Deltaproteobacteria bacterium RBG_13_53_10]|nr:MAG: hypothetical protein A2170_15705 [Deltaproteobacteria bacterium RBG_13_53_10]